MRSMIHPDEGTFVVNLQGSLELLASLFSKYMLLIRQTRLGYSEGGEDVLGYSWNAFPNIQRCIKVSLLVVQSYFKTI
ncbi:hypothetical protein NC651_031441 [Populus alba x Populus x berolinensis]|nr:hypothetical protein NC651_031441 [Populus alba x Populus x berolinensis]